MDLPAYLDTAGVKAYLKQSARDRKRLVLPGVFSDDERLLAVQAALGERLTREFPVSPLHHGWMTGLGISQNFYRLRTAAGFGMSPVGVPLGQQVLPEKKRHSLLPNDKRLLSEVASLFFAEWRAQPVAISTISSSGVPHFAYDFISKDRMWDNCFDNLDAIVAASLSRDSDTLARLARDLSIVQAYSVSRRAQQDGVKVATEDGVDFLVTKNRAVRTFDGERVAADKLAVE
jgi:hypothetical protein